MSAEDRIITMSPTAYAEIIRNAQANAWEECRKAGIDNLFPLRPEDNPYRDGASK